MSPIDYLRKQIDLKDECESRRTGTLTNMPWLVLVPCVLLAVALSWQTILKLVQWLRLHKNGPAETSGGLLRALRDKVVRIDTLHWGKVTYIGRCDTPDVI